MPPPAPPFPLPVHTLAPAAAAALGVDPDGAVLARPDARVVARWPSGPRSLSLGDLRLSPAPSPDWGWRPRGGGHGQHRPLVAPAGSRWLVRDPERGRLRSRPPAGGAPAAPRPPPPRRRR